MRPFTIKLAEHEHTRLDELRAAFGLRSKADLVRYWIASTPTEPRDVVRGQLAASVKP